MGWPNNQAAHLSTDPIPFQTSSDAAPCCLRPSRSPGSSSERIDVAWSELHLDGPVGVLFQATLLTSARAHASRARRSRTEESDCSATNRGGSQQGRLLVCFLVGVGLFGNPKFSKYWSLSGVSVLGQQDVSCHSCLFLFALGLDESCDVM